MTITAQPHTARSDRSKTILRASILALSLVTLVSPIGSVNVLGMEQSFSGSATLFGFLPILGAATALVVPLVNNNLVRFARYADIATFVFASIFLVWALYTVFGGMADIASQQRQINQFVGGSNFTAPSMMSITPSLGLVFVVALAGLSGFCGYRAVRS